MISTDKDVFLCAAYTPPSESPHFNEETFSSPEGEINQSQIQGNVLVCGHLNATTADKPDTIDTHGNKHALDSNNLPPHHIYPTRNH